MEGRNAGRNEWRKQGKEARQGSQEGRKKDALLVSNSIWYSKFLEASEEGKGRKEEGRVASSAVTAAAFGRSSFSIFRFLGWHAQHLQQQNNNEKNNKQHSEWNIVKPHSSGIFRSDNCSIWTASAAGIATAFGNTASGVPAVTGYHYFALDANLVFFDPVDFSISVWCEFIFFHASACLLLVLSMKCAM